MYESTGASIENRPVPVPVAEPIVTSAAVLIIPRRPVWHTSIVPEVHSDVRHMLREIATVGETRDDPRFIPLSVRDAPPVCGVLSTIRDSTGPASTQRLVHAPSHRSIHAKPTLCMLTRAHSVLACKACQHYALVRTIEAECMLQASAHNAAHGQRPERIRPICLARMAMSSPGV